MNMKAIFATMIAAAGLLIGSAIPAAADVPTYRHKAQVPATMSDRLKLASAYHKAPGARMQGPAGAMVARRVVVGGTEILVVTSPGRNSPRDIALAARTQTGCFVPKNASFRTIFAGGPIPKGYALPCAG